MSSSASTAQKLKQRLFSAPPDPTFQDDASPPSLKIDIPSPARPGTPSSLRPTLVGKRQQLEAGLPSSANSGNSIIPGPVVPIPPPVDDGPGTGSGSTDEPSSANGGAGGGGVEQQQSSRPSPPPTETYRQRLLKKLGGTKFTSVEEYRLDQDRSRSKHWKRWGPYLSERQWATVREDYSANGDAWTDFPHEHSRSRVYRWGEDGMGGISDNHGRLCWSLALWNEEDDILKERLFGVTGHQGNHGEDVKELYYYLDSTVRFGCVPPLILSINQPLTISPFLLFSSQRIRT